MSRKKFQNNISVRPIDNKETYPFLLNAHYAKRIPSISYAFGLFIDEKLVGVVCYGTPAANNVRIGIAGKEHAHCVLELNRLCLITQHKNAASMLVSASLKMLPKPSIIISFADISQGHVGFVYQACNFIYTGLSAKRTDWAVRGMEHLNGQTVTDLSRHVKTINRGDRANYMRMTYGDDFYLKDRPRKHRYVYIVGDRYQRKGLMKFINYAPRPYPKEKSAIIVPVVEKDVGVLNF